MLGRHGPAGGRRGARLGGPHAGWHGATDIDIHPDGVHLLSCGWDNTAKVTELATGRPVLTVRTADLANWNACYRPDGRHLAVPWDVHKIDTHPAILVCDAATGQEVSRLTDPSVARAAPRYSPDGRVLYAAAGGVTVQAFDADTGRPLPVAFKGHTGWIQSIVLSRDGGRMLTGSDDGTGRVWDTATGHAGIVRDARFSPAGDAVVPAGEDGTARVRDAPRD